MGSVEIIRENLQEKIIVKYCAYYVELVPFMRHLVQGVEVMIRSLDFTTLFVDLKLKENND